MSTFPSFTHAVVLAASLFALGCGSEEAAQKAPLPIVLSSLDVTTVRRDAIATGPRVSGTLEPAQKAVIRAEAGGSVLEVNVEIGALVKDGDRLGRIESSGAGDLWRSTQVAVTAAAQDLQNAHRELDRLQRLANAGAVSPRDLELASSAHASAGARLEGAKAQQASAGSQAARTSLRSPINGVVSERAVNPGDVVAPGSPMFTVIDPSSLRLEGSVPAAAAASLRVGTSVQFAVQGFGDQRFTGQITSISPAVNPVSRQIPILVSIPNTSGKLLSGLFVDGHVATEEREGLVVPSAAVDLTGSVPVVSRITGGKVERVEVQIGIQDEASEQIEIVSGVSEGDVLLVGAAQDVAPGTEVEVQGSTTGTGPKAGASAG